MKDKSVFVNSLKRIGLTKQYAVPSDGTDLQIASGNQTSSTGTAITLATITVAPGYDCIIGDVDYFTTSSTGGTLTVTYTVGTTTVTRYVALAAAGFTELAHDFGDHPFMALRNSKSSTSNITVNITSTTTTTSSQYVANAAYVLRKVRR